MNFELKITFETTKAKTVQDTIKLCNRMDTFVSGKSNEISFNDKNIFANAHILFEIVSLISRFKTSRFFFNDQELHLNELKKLLSPVYCYRDYLNAPIQPIYCSNPKGQPGWGCKLLDSVKRHWRFDCENYIYWFEIGRFITDDTWQIDKTELENLIKRDADQQHLEICPIFNFQKAIRIIKELPELIDLENSKVWEKSYTVEIGEDNKEIGIKPKAPKLGSVKIDFGLLEEEGGF